MAAGNRNAGTRQDTWIIRVHLNGENMGVWDKKTGGKVDSDELKYYPGGMAKPQSLGGRRMTENLTLQREYDRIDDHGQINKWFNAVGRGKLDVSIRPMDIDGHEFGKAINYTGILKSAEMPDIDSESTTASLMGIEVSVAGFPSAT